MAVENLSRIEGFEKIPLLWQSFLWKWGGFFLSDHEADEKATLAQEVGMTNQALEASFAVYDTLFRIPNGWFITNQGTKSLKLFPCPFKGVGAQYRLKKSGHATFNDAIGVSAHQYLMRNLVLWNNSAVELLHFGAPRAH